MSRKYRKLTTTQGAALSITGLVSGLFAWQAALLPTRLSVRILLLLFASFTLWFFSHDLTHHIVGRIGGIKFRYYFFGRSAIRKLKVPVLPALMERIPVLVLKVDERSMSQATPRARRWMHASGAIASMALPWLVIPAAFELGPVWVGLLFTIVIVGNDLFSLYFSPKTGDLYRARTVKG